MTITARAFDAAVRQRQRAAKDGKPFKPVTLRDAQVPGLSLVIGKTGESWRFQFKPRGTRPDGSRYPTRTLTLGTHAELSLDEAREATVAAKASVRSGSDPVEERQIERAKNIADRQARRTCRDLLEDFETDVESRESIRRPGQAVTADYARAIVRGAEYSLGALGVMDLGPDAITARAIARLFRNKSGTNWAIRHGALRQFLDFALAEDLVELNVARAVPGPKGSNERSRVLTADELRTLWTAAESLDPVKRDLLRFLICVPCRIGEAIGMKWDDLNADRTLWTQHGTKTKNGQEHVFALHDLARDILESRRGKTPRGPVFPARDGGHIRGRGHLSAKFHDVAPSVRDWTPHDIRRSIVSHLGEAKTGFDESVIDRVINHSASATLKGVVGIYQRAERRQEQAAVMHAWGRILAGILDPESETENVVAIR